jgi:hypothetical protein
MAAVAEAENRNALIKRPMRARTIRPPIRAHKAKADMLETRAFQQASLVPRKWLLEFQQRGLLFLQPFLGR